MIKGEKFKLILIGTIFSFSVLIALPEIPVVVDSSIFTTNSQIGGYKITIPSNGGDKTLDLSEFKKGRGVGESQKVVFSVDDNQPTSEELASLSKVVKNRLIGAGISDFQIVEDNGGFYIAIPEFESSERVSSLIMGSGNIDFRKVKNPSDWNQESITSFYMESDRWESTELSKSDFDSFRYFTSQNGSSGIQISFTPEGRKKFYDIASQNIGFPIAIYVNDSQYPILMPVISQDILTNTNIDPSITGTFSQQAINDVNLQLRNPLPVKISYIDTAVSEPLFGYDFLSTYIRSIAIGILFVSILFILRFGLTGFLYTFSTGISFLMFLALAKIVSLSVTPAFVLGSILLTGIISAISYSAFKGLKQKVLEGKPFDYAYYDVFGKDKDRLATPSILLLSISLVLTIATTGVLKSFASALTVGFLDLIICYSFILPTLIGVFGGHRK